jgi:hypothetical protein
MPSTALTTLQAELAGVRTDPYLLSVTPAQSVHCGVVQVRPDDTGAALRVTPVPSRWPDSDAAGLTRVTLLWPPNEPGGYSLIVDGTAGPAGPADSDALTVTVSRAVWHRPGVGADGSSCGSDCKPILGKGAAVAV